MKFNTPAKWSPCELEYLNAHKEESINQLSLFLGKSRNGIKTKLLELDGKEVPKNKTKRSNIGRRQDLNMFMRSSWEANVARLLNYQGLRWEYEPDVFTFPGIKHGTTSYCPDFRVWTSKEEYFWLEIKGLLEGPDKARTRRFKKFFPAEFAKLQVITGSPNVKTTKFFKEQSVKIYGYMNELNKEWRDKIPNWE